jgi:hypothetical protein
MEFSSAYVFGRPAPAERRGIGWFVIENRWFSSARKIKI